MIYASGVAAVFCNQTLIVCWCVGVHMANSMRVEAYLPYELIREIDDTTDNRSEFIREAVSEKLDNDA